MPPRRAIDGRARPARAVQRRTARALLLAVRVAVLADSAPPSKRLRAPRGARSGERAPAGPAAPPSGRRRPARAARPAGTRPPPAPAARAPPAGPRPRRPRRPPPWPAAARRPRLRAARHASSLPPSAARQARARTREAPRQAWHTRALGASRGRRLAAAHGGIPHAAPRPPGASAGGGGAPRLADRNWCSALDRRPHASSASSSAAGSAGPEYLRIRPRSCARRSATAAAPSAHASAAARSVTSTPARAARARVSARRGAPRSRRRVCIATRNVLPPRVARRAPAGRGPSPGLPGDRPARRSAPGRPPAQHG